MRHPTLGAEDVSRGRHWSCWPAAIGAACLGLSAFATSTIGFQEKFQSRIDLVYLDVSVLDKDRRPVRGLTAADFTVLEDGKVRPLAAFVPVDLPESHAGVQSPVGDVVTNDVPREGRLVVVVFDWTIRLEDQPLARRIAIAAIGNLGPGDMAAVTFTSPFANAGSVQDFTTDKDLLLKAIGEPFAAAPHAPPTAVGNRNGVMIDDVEGYESGHCYCGVCSLDSITRIAEALRNTPERRKEVLFIGTSFPGIEAPDLRRSGGIGFGGLRGDPNPGVCHTTVLDARKRLVRAIGLANVVVHVLDPVGIETDANSPGGGTRQRMVQRQANLPTLAQLTGGRVVMNTNAPDEHLSDILSESQSYYVMGFSPVDASSRGRDRRLEVKVRGKGLNVRARNAYQEAGPPGSTTLDVVTNTSTLAKELRPILPTNDLPLYLTVIPFANATTQESGVAIIAGVRGAGGRSDSSSPGHQNTRVLAAAFDQKASVVAVADRGDVLSTPGGLAYEVLTSLVLRPGRYQIRVAIEAGGKWGSVYSHVSVPDVSREALSLTGPLISRGGTGSMPGDIEDVFPLMPTGQREFTLREPVRAWVRIHQGQQGPIRPVRMRVAILSRTGRRHVVDDTVLDVDRFGPHRSADYLHELSVQGLEPSDYALELECSAGAARVVRRLTFSTK